MSLMQLLAVGKSFRTIDNRPSPYRMAQQYYLPRFGPVHGVPAKKTVTASLPVPAVGAAAGGLGAPAGHCPVAGAGTATATAATGDRARGARRWFGWGRKAAVRRDAWSAVQGELALDLVKVVRNDLNESDLELVPVVARTVSPPEAGSAAARWEERSVEKWSRSWLARWVWRWRGA